MKPIPLSNFTVTLAGSGKQFAAQAGEPVLQAARRSGLALPYSCLGGSCGSCKATIVSGEVHYPLQAPTALSREERAQHQALLCQAVALSNLTVIAREVPSVANMPLRQMAMRVQSKDQLAEDVMRLTLRAPRNQTLRYLPGQYLDILLPEGKRRAFSIANAPEKHEDIELHIRHVQGGDFTHWVFSELQVGKVLRIEAPLGTFVPREDSERAMIMVAGGTGFAPIKALIEHFIFLGSRRPIHLYWGARQQRDLYLPDLPAQWARQHAALFYTSVLSDPSEEEATRHRVGFVHDIVREDFPDLSEFDLYMSGPPPMIDAARHSFIDSGLQADRLYYDSFEYAPDVLAAIVNSRAGIRHD